MIDFNKRSKSSFNLSIGTGLMLESLFKPITARYDEKREIPNVVGVNNYQGHLYNLLTLARNICTAFDVKIDPAIIFKDRGFIQTLEEEIEMIKYLYSETKCKPVFYLPKYTAIEAKLNNGKDRPKTKPILVYTDIYKTLLKASLDKKSVNLNSNNYLHNIDLLPRVGKDKRILMTTSFMIDTFAPMNLELIDTHTGVHYKRELFYKKYDRIGSKDMSYIPHSEYFLYLMGDKNMSMISSPMIRLLIQSTAEANLWKHDTTEYTIKEFIKRHAEISKLVNDNFKKIYK